MKNVEIERKWLVESLDFNKIVREISELKNIKQSYIDKNQRVRCINDKEYTQTIKSGSGLRREEYEIPISYEQYVTLFSACKKTLYKKRYVLPHGYYNLEIDVYKDKDFITVEVEFENEGDAKRFTTPDWFGKEIVNSQKYSNYNIAKDI